MKRSVVVGLISLTLALIAAQCGAIQQSATSNQTAAEAGAAGDEANQQAAQDNAVQAGAAESEEVVEAVSDTAGEEAAESEAAADNSAGAVADTSHQGNDCSDPFAGVQVRFNGEVWQAERIARFVGSDLVDPASGLATNFCLHNVDYNEIISGGPPPDGIPPIDNPNFDSIAEGDAWLDDVQPVISLEINGDARAYPLAILTRHEIANDEVGGVPVAVTFCPLCNAGLVFDREVNGQVLRFGVSGNLRNSDLIMWDNKTLSWWQQFTGEAIVGDMSGTQLELVPAQMVAWKDFKAAYPDGKVLSTNGRNYGVNPYVGYDSSTRPFLFIDTPDPRLPALERVLGYVSDDIAKAYPMPLVADNGVIEDNVNGQDIAIFFEPGQVSALDKSAIADSKEVGSAAIFIPEIDGQQLTFSYDNGLIRDNETGSEWNIFGRAITGELEGKQLTPLLSRVDFWFAWAAFQSETEVYEG